MKKNKMAFLVACIGIIGCKALTFAETETFYDTDSVWYGESTLSSESGDAEEGAQEELQIDPSLWVGNQEVYSVEVNDLLSLSVEILDENGNEVENPAQYGASHLWYKGAGEALEVIEGAAESNLELVVDEEMARCDRPFYIECITEIMGAEISSRFTLTREHSVIVDPEIPATGSTIGLTEGSHCEVCGQIIVEQELIPRITVDAPVLVKAYNTIDSVEIIWELSEKAEKYRVFRKTNGSGWKVIADLDSSMNRYSDTSVVGNTTYIYTVRCISEDGSTYMSDYDHKGIGMLYLKAPVIVAASRDINGVKLTYGSVSGAEKYRIYRKTEETNWQSIGCTAAMTFTDKTAESGIRYTYTVRATNGAGVAISSYYQAGESILYVSVPVIKNANLNASGVMLSWNPVAGAVKYRVFRRTSITDKWTILGDMTGESFLDQTVKNNVTYFYTLRCMDEEGKWTTYDKIGTGVLYFSAPKLVSAQNGSDGITVKWNAVAGTEKYRVFRKTEGESWSVLGNTKSTSWTDKTAKSGVEYTYTVRCMNSLGKYISAYDKNGVTALRIGNGKIGKLLNTNAGVRIYWEEIPGAVRYVIQRTDGKTSYQKIAEITDLDKLNYIDTEANSNGASYRYAVRAYIGDAKGTVTPQTIYYLTVPQISNVKNNSSGAMTIEWNKNLKAEGYQISYRVGNAEKRLLINGNTKVKSTITGLKKGVTYTVKVRSYKKQSGMTYWSAWSDGINIEIRK